MLIWKGVLSSVILWIYLVLVLKALQQSGYKKIWKKENPMVTFGILLTAVLSLSLAKFFESLILTFLGLNEMPFPCFLKFSRFNENIDGILESFDYFLKLESFEVSWWVGSLHILFTLDDFARWTSGISF